MRLAKPQPEPESINLMDLQGVKIELRKRKVVLLGAPPFSSDSVEKMEAELTTSSQTSSTRPLLPTELSTGLTLELEVSQSHCSLGYKNWVT